MSIVGTLVIGFLAGLVAKLLVPGRDFKGFIVTIVLGIVGAFLATWLGRELGWYHDGEAAGFVGAVIGSIIVLTIYRVILGQRSLT